MAVFQSGNDGEGVEKEKVQTRAATVEIRVEISQKAKKQNQHMD